MKITKIMKFGGTSVGSPKAIKAVAGLVSYSAKKEGVAVIVSAFSSVTDGLLKLAKFAGQGKDFAAGLKELEKRHFIAVKALVKKPKVRKAALAEVGLMLAELNDALLEIKLKKSVQPQDLDYIASFGERLSATIVAASIHGGYFVDARELVKTDDNFINARVDFNKTNRRIKIYFLRKRGIPVITGFIGSTAKGVTTTIGRGGSDYSASIFGAALNVKAIEIWTDVSGVMSADPKLVKNAVVLPEISYEEAVEMAYFGAKVIHPATMLPAIKKGILILIKNTFEPLESGTLIAKKSVDGFLAKAVTSIDDIVLVNVAGVSLAGIPGSAARVFEATKKAKANVILISQASSEHTICFAIKNDELKSALKFLNKEFTKEIKAGQVNLSVIPGQAIIAAVGEGMRGKPGISGRLFKILGDNGVNVTAIAQGGSEFNISLTVSTESRVQALNLIHNEFFFGGQKNLFLAGTGNIGGTLLKQIKDLPGSKIKICGIINDQKMLISETGIDLAKWRRLLDKGEPADLGKWLKMAEEMILADKVFVDCTASEPIAKKYIEIAEAGFNIVTPNKKFNTRSFREYSWLREIMNKNKKRFMYETNVGAGLPLISTIRDLLLSGDKIVKIEGIFSGTLSYLFNTYDGTRPFSKIVAEAKELSYTEPDPREDLNGNDVGRKLLVLAREIGWLLEFKDVVIENLVPEGLRGKISVVEFMKSLRHYDAYYKKLTEKAYGQNKVLRYVARLERGRAVASLQAVSLDNPLASTRGADNIFAIYTKRYNKRPLVVQGPGAGAEVTAGGVLADILKI